MQQLKVGGLKLLNLFGHFNIWIFFLALSLNAGTFEKFQTVPTRKVGGSAFFTNQQWNSYEPLPLRKLYMLHKPKLITPLKEQKIKDVGPKIRIVIAKRKVYKKVMPTQIAKDIDINFFTTRLSFTKPSKISDAKFYPQTQKGISHFFRVASFSEYSSLLSEIKRAKVDINLNDWGLYLLVQQISDKIFQNKDDANLFNWFIFNKLGYNVRAGIIRKHIVLIFKTKQHVNYTQCYKINNELFYVLDTKAKDGVIYTYTKDYPNTDKEFDLSILEIPNFNLDVKTKDLKFTLDNKEYVFQYKYNQNLLDFLGTYPRVQSDVYFNAPLDDISYQAIGKSLKKYVDRKKASTAINFVLHFVQDAFKYQCDQDQFKKEKFMFAQETLYYDKSDAEDRVSLFSYLIRKFFSFSVVGVKYKDHMITGLYIPILGDNVIDGKKKYIVADPTYNNANIGQSVAKYKRVKPVAFIELKK